MRLLLALALMLLTTIARAADLAPEALKIVLESKGSRKVSKGDGGPTIADYQKAWKRACDQLGSALTAGKGPWGFGVFSEHSCYRGKKNVGGPDKGARWVLGIVDGKKGVTLKLSFAGSERATVTIPASLFTFSFFEDEEYADLVAFALLDQLPFGMKATMPLKGRHWRAGLSKTFKFKVPEAPEELVIFGLAWDSKVSAWRSRVVGTAKRDKVTAPRKKKDGKNTLLVGGGVSYAVPEDVAAELKDGNYWAQDARGPGARKAELAKIIKDAHLTLETAAANGSLLDFLGGASASILANLFRSAAFGYVGMRYGLEVLPGNDLLKKTHIFSLLVEIRGGPLKGLRYYYDKLPLTEITLKNLDGPQGKASIAWSRHVLGYSFGLNPGFLLDRITIDPKLGMWRFDAALPVPNEDDPDAIRVAKFSLGKTFSLALEIGGELLSDWYTLRGWYSIDGGYSLLKSGGTVRSNRFGADAFFTAGPTFPIFGIPFKTALLGFYVYESVNVSTGEKEELQPGEVAISSVPYSAGYVGGGVLITW